MSVVTKYRLAESVASLIEGGDLKAASSISLPEIMIACGNVINALLKVEHFSVNEAMGEKIPNGSVLGLYEDIAVTSYEGKSKCTLPIKPLKLPRNMGIFAIYGKFKENGNYELDKEFIPLQMGQGGLIKSQPMINDLLGQIGYENFGLDVIFTKDLPAIYPYVRVAMRLAIMDIDQYGDYDVLPILPEQEIEVIQQVYKLYSTQPLADKVVDATVAELKDIALNKQRQS